MKPEPQCDNCQDSSFEYFDIELVACRDGKLRCRRCLAANADREYPGWELQARAER